MHLILRRLVAFSILAIVASDLPAQGAGQVARSANGAIATANPLATLAARAMLERGGNAADAAVAAAFAIAVVQPSMNSIGGRNQILVRRADGSVVGIDGATQVPAAYDAATAPRATFGYATIATPGAVAGLMRLYGEHASLPLATLMAPAIEYAETGFRLLPQEERFHADRPEELAQSAGARKALLHADGSPYRAGELLVQPDLARTLRRIAGDSGRSFYTGDIARTIADDMRAQGGFVTLADLAQYRALDSRIVRGSYRGYELVGLDVPSAGVVSIQALQILEQFDRASMSPVEWALAAGRAIRVASGELGRLGTDTAAARATSKAWARTRAEQLRAALRSGLDNTGDADAGHYTTHIVVTDAQGMSVTLTQTVGPVLGSKVVTPGLGFHYASSLGGYLMAASAGERTRSYISPLLVLKEGQPVLVLGAAGGTRIVASVVQVVSRIIDEGLDLPRAMAAPRVFAPSDSVIEMERADGGWSVADVRAMETLGVRVREVSAPTSFALVQALWRDPATGEWVAVSEPDGEGLALGVGPRAPRPGAPTRRP